MTTTSRSSSPALRLSVAKFPAPVKLSGLRAWWTAGRAVRAGVPLTRLLESWLGRYQGARPTFWVAELPSVGDARPVLLPNPVPDPLAELLADPSDAPGPTEAGEGPRVAAIRWVRSKRQAEAAQLERDLHEAEAEAELARERARQSTDVARDRAQILAGAIEEGNVLADATLARDAASRGRPVLTISWSHVAFYVLEIVAVISETWQFLTPLLNSFGFHLSEDQTALDVPLASLLPTLALALVLAIAVFAGATCTLDLAFPRRNGVEGVSRNWGLLLSVAVGTLGLLSAMAFYRHGLAVAAAAADASLDPGLSASEPPFILFALLAFGLPIVVACLRHWWILPINEQRAAVRAAQAAFDDADHRARANQERLAKLQDIATTAHAELEARRQATLTRLRSLNERAQHAEEELRRQHQAELAYGAAWSRSVLAALHLLAYEFERQARRKGHVELLDSKWGFSATTEASGLHRLALESPGADRQVG